MSFLIDLECGKCETHFSADVLQNLCPACGKPLLARYDLAAAARSMTPETMAARGSTLWRYREVLPVRDEMHIVSLGEGGTPLLHAGRLGSLLDMAELYIKDESLNPTGSFKARGLCMAVSRAKELGATALAIPSAGNAAGALCAYAARAGLPAFVFMPKDTPAAFVAECRATGASVELVDGLITDCGRIVAERKEHEGWFDVSTLKEPYRVEGKKTMGYELAEQFDGTLPDAILYPAGGGTGMIGMWKAFDEMETLGWIGSERPRMIAVQAEGCRPIVRAFEQGWEDAPEWETAHTLASGLRVPRAVGDFLMLRAIRRSGGCAIAVSDEDMVQGIRILASHEGIFAAPESGATVAALRALLADGRIDRAERIVLFNTGSGHKYVDNFTL
ncbi:MAG: threonine synthase [candidate division Zixibacteria bacterium]|nr:threonine synthase [candidate division Zixibacteria bacterium]